MGSRFNYLSIHSILLSELDSVTTSLFARWDAFCGFSSLHEYGFCYFYYLAFSLYSYLASQNRSDIYAVECTS